MKEYLHKKIYSFLLVCCVAGTAWAQDRNVSGKISNADGEALPGVNVVIKGSQQGTITDVDGNYTIPASDDDVLVFSFIGYTTAEEAVGTRSQINVSLTENIEALSEVVVTALGLSQEKKAISYSVQEVASQEIMQSREPSVVDALNAKVAGVQVVRQGGAAGAGSSITIRGFSSVSGTNQPLFVIDGVPMNNSFSSTLGTSSGVDASNRAMDINPNDIESMSVLKGPAATALYGIQGGNGVILITTKKGSNAKKGYTVNVSTNTSTDRIMNYFPQQRRYGQGDNGVFNGGTTFNHYGPPISTLRYAPGDNPVDPNGFIVDMNNPEATDARVPTINNQEIFFRNGFTTDNHISIASNQDNSSFYFSVGNMYQQGIIPNNDFNRASAKLSAETRLGDKFSLSGTVNYSNSRSTKFGRGDNFSDAIQGLYRTPATFDNSIGYVYPNGVQRNFRGAIDGTAAFSPDNPFWTVNTSPYNDLINRVISYAQANYDPTDWLSIVGRIGYDYANDERTQIWAPGSTGGDAVAASGALGGRIYENNISDRILNTDIIVTARKQFTEKLDGSLMVGHNMFSSASNRLFLDGRNFSIPSLYNVANTQENQVLTQNLTERQTQAVYSRLNLNYDGFLYLELTGRNEWASTLPANSRSFPYGSVSMGFIFTEIMDFNTDIFSYGKLRASYAQVGNSAPPYATETFYDVGAVSTRYAGGLRFPVDGIGGVLLSRTAGNNQLVPESNTTTEVGVDLGFLQNRVNLEFTYYNSLSRDQIINVEVPASTGFTFQRINAGEIQNRGVEVVLSGTPVQSPNFSWNTTLNFTRNRNFVNELPDDQPIVTNLYGARVTSALIPGEQFGVFYGNAFKRNENGDKLITPDGYPQFADEQQIIGNPNPKFLIGFRNALNYRNLRLSFLWDIRKGGDVVNVTRYWTDGSGIADHTLDRNKVVVYDGVIDNPGGDNDGQPNTTPIILNQAALQGGAGTGALGREMAERWIQDGSWIRLRDVTLSYSIPENLISNLGMSNLELGVYGRNLLLFTNYNGIDPETNLGGPDAPQGLDAFTSPNTRSFGFTLNATF